MASSNEAQGRSRLYTLCQALYMAGITADILSIVRDVPELSATVPETMAVDELGAMHQQLFGFNLFPFESTFLGQEQLLGNVISEAVDAQFRRLGYLPTGESGAADHIGEELGLLAHLCAAEADAVEDQKWLIVQQLRRAQKSFLEEHLLRWLAPFIVAVQRHEIPFFSEVATITLTLVAEHYLALLQDEYGEGMPAKAPKIPTTQSAGQQHVTWQLIAAPDLVADPKTSLRDIAIFLLTPVYSGIFLSRDLINQLGRMQRLPRGFGSREQMFTNLLRTAAQYEATPVLLEGIEAELANWGNRYEAIVQYHPILVPFVQPWLTRLEDTSATVVEMGRLIILEATEL